MRKIMVGLVYGGRSGEHEVSVKSAESIRSNLDKSKYEVVDIFINKTGKFEMSLLAQVDVVFPIVHGTYGEDGSLQGMLEMLDVAYVGAGVLGSAIGMDKDVQKRLLMQAGIPVAPFQVIKKKEKIHIGFPAFVKPVNMGSSVGISRVRDEKELSAAIDEAFKYDTKVIIEGEVKGREIEVSVLGNEKPEASVPGEIIPVNHDFYDYEAKYLDESGSRLEIPTKVTNEQMEKLKSMAIKTYEVLECKGMARVDMFLTPDGEIVVNEINTLPGFTNNSMYPKLWEASGLAYAKLLDRLIELAIERKKMSDGLKRSYSV